LAEYGTIQLEFKYLAYHTGEKKYWDVAEAPLKYIQVCRYNCIYIHICLILHTRVCTYIYTHIYIYIYIYIYVYIYIYIYIYI